MIYISSVLCMLVIYTSSYFLNVYFWWLWSCSDESEDSEEESTSG
jgi:hypothetical protein